MIWTVDYGNGPIPCEIPHAWRQEVDVRWEGPAVYRTHVEVPDGEPFLVFEGVSYEALVSINNELVTSHRGIWDAFEVNLGRWKGETVDLEVKVTKNGGAKFPVKDVLSGFLPYVYHTFGGIYKPVHIRQGRAQTNYPNNRVEVRGREIWFDGKPFYARGVLSWGWYPELGHSNPPLEVIQEEIRIAKAYGFNLVKFCLWVPPHEYLEELDQNGMAAWLELPLWDPSPSPLVQDAFATELERVVEQYKHHSNIILWTVGCELSEATPPEFRQKMVEMVKSKTGSPLVKDNSGGAEMYGGDPREFGDFDDFHPYCDTPFYPQVLESLLPGPRPRVPVLLGEFNDIDVHRDVAATLERNPYWISTDPSLNDQGVRWQHDFPSALPLTRFGKPEHDREHKRLMASSLAKAEFIRKFVQETVRSREEISGYVITGWIDTPISTAGFVDELGKPRFGDSNVRKWNSPDCLFLIPQRRPPWVNGANRPGYELPFDHFEGRALIKVGLHSESGKEGSLEWELIRFSWDGGQRGLVASGRGDSVSIQPLGSKQVGVVFVERLEPGGYLLRSKFGDVTNSWPIWVCEKWSDVDWEVVDPAGLTGLKSVGKSGRITFRPPSDLPNEPTVVLLTDDETDPMPFWREAAYEFDDVFWNAIGMRETWERLLAVSSDRSINPALLERFPGGRSLLTRVDTRTYRESSLLYSVGNTVFTTLRPYGGLGCQPMGVAKNPSGAQLMRGLLRLALGEFE
ncbi:MAG TPA: hypothetical protein PKA27_17025 [Fimbriimonadaceae bacterium]|nr:hypothetical protein [Fimbriimonadaceae bacterium]